MTSPNPQAYQTLDYSGVSPSFPQLQNHSFASPGYNTNPNFNASNVSQSLLLGYMPTSANPSYTAPHPAYQNSPGFAFKDQRGALNWKNIANLDVDELIAKGDMQAIQSYLSNFASTELSKDDLARFGDTTLLKVLRLSQFGVGHLLNTQSQLANQSQMLDFHYRNSEKKVRQLEEHAKQKQTEVEQLRDETELKEHILNAYQNHLGSTFLKCNYCPKYFKSQDFLDQHLQRRHAAVWSADSQKERVLKSPAPHDAFIKIQDQGSTVKNLHATEFGKTFEDGTTMEDSMLFENMLNKYKQEEDKKMSLMLSSLELQISAVLQTNKDLSVKVAEMEQKLKTQSTPVKAAPVDSKDSPVNSNQSNPQVTAPLGMAFGVLQGKSFVLSPVHQTMTHKINTRSLDEIQDIKAKPQVFNAGSLLNDHSDMEIVKNKDRFKAGSLVSIDSEQEEAAKPKDIKAKQIFNAGSLLSVGEEPEPEQEQRHEQGQGQEKEKEKGAAPRHVEDVKPEKQKYARQGFKAGSLHEVEDEEDGEAKVNTVKKMEGVKRQVFYAGDLKTDRDHYATFNAAELEDDTSFVTKKQMKSLNEIKEEKELETEQDEEYRKGKKLSQEIQKVQEEVHEKPTEKEHEHHRDEQEEEYEKSDKEKKKDKEKKEKKSKSEDEIVEKYKKSVKKADKFIDHKYEHPIKKERYSEAEEDLETKVNNKCRQLLKVEYQDLEKTDIADLEEMRLNLKNINRENHKTVEDMTQHYRNTARDSIESLPKPEKKEKKEKKDKESKKEFKESPKLKPAQPSKKELTDSEELMKLVVNSGESKSRADPFSHQNVSTPKKNVFDSQNLEKQIGQKDNNNMLKKSIESQRSDYL